MNSANGMRQENPFCLALAVSKIARALNCCRTTSVWKPLGLLLRSVLIHLTKCIPPLPGPAESCLSNSKLVARKVAAAVRILCSCENCPFDIVLNFCNYVKIMIKV